MVVTVKDQADCEAVCKRASRLGWVVKEHRSEGFYVFSFAHLGTAKSATGDASRSRLKALVNASRAVSPHLV